MIVPSFTFPATATAFSLRGARVVFCDVHPTTLNLDERMLESIVSERTRAVVPVHYAGVGCEMDGILRIADREGLAVVEDNAHGLFGRYRGKPLGTFGVLATQSFHETKNCTCGEGGALVINDERLSCRAEVVREKGTNRKSFFRGEVDKYTWVDEGSSYVLVGTPRSVPGSAARSQRCDPGCSEAALAHGTRGHSTSGPLRSAPALPYIPDHCEQPYHMFYVLLPSLEYRTALIEHLRARSILAVFHYLPLHLSPMGERHGGRRGTCPVTEDVADRLLRLPFYVGLGPNEQDEVIDSILEFSDG